MHMCRVWTNSLAWRVHDHNVCAFVLREKDVEPSHPILSSAFPIVQSTETLTFREDHQLEPSVHTSSAWIGPC